MNPGIPNDEARERALGMTLHAIQRQHGKGTVMRFDDVPEPVAVTSTGSLGLDLALGCGGYPRGRIIEIYGPEASGKSTLALHAVAAMQATGGTAAFIDAEHALDPRYAAAVGVRLPKLILSQPDDGEQAFDVVEALVRSGTVDIVVIDSVAALVPRDELQGGMSDVQVGLQARMMSKAMRKLTSVVAKSTTTLLFINQIRQRIGVTFGPSEVTPGGNALKYYASIRLDVRRVGSVKRGEEGVGSRTRVKVVKNKLATPFRQVEFDLVYGRGIDRVAELLALAEAHGAVSCIGVGAGGCYSFGDVRLGLGRTRALEHLEADPLLCDRIERVLRAQAGPWRGVTGSDPLRT